MLESLQARPRARAPITLTRFALAAVVLPAACSRSGPAAETEAAGDALPAESGAGGGASSGDESAPSRTGSEPQAAPPGAAATSGSAAGEPNAGGTGTVGDAVAGSPTGDAATGGRGYLLLREHSPARPRGRLLPVELRAGVARPLEPYVVDAVPFQESRRVLAAHDGTRRFAVAERDGETYRVSVVSVTGDASRSVPIDEPPAALMLAGRALLIGEAGGVAWVDLESPQPRRVPLVTRTDVPRKAYDLLTRDGDLVIAIDDVVRPIFADSIRIGPDGVPRHVAPFEMPSLINGSYRGAQVLRRTEGSGTLYAVASYVVMSGHGQDLVALPLSQGRASVTREPINTRPSTSPPVLEEHVPRGAGLPAELAAGDHLTPFTGLAVARRDGVAQRLLVAAGDRGLLLLPLDFGPGTRAEVVELGGPVTDVLADGDRLFALAGGDLVTLAWRGDTLGTASRADLHGEYDAIVR